MLLPRGIHLGVHAVARDQLVVGPELDDAAIVDDRDLVGPYGFASDWAGSTQAPASAELVLNTASPIRPGSVAAEPVALLGASDAAIRAAGTVVSADDDAGAALLALLG